MSSKGNKNSQDDSSNQSSPSPSFSLFDCWLQQNHRDGLMLEPLPSEIDPEYVYPTSSFPSISKFDLNVKVPAIIIPAKRTNKIRKEIQSIMFHRPQIKIVLELTEEEDNFELPVADNNQPYIQKQCRKLLLDPRKVRKSLMNKNENNESDNSHNGNGNAIKNHPAIQKANDVLQSLLDTKQAIYNEHTIKFTYYDYTIDEIFRIVLPPSIEEIPSSFETIGHIIHVNLRDNLLTYKYIIGKVLLDKYTPRIQTIVNKIRTIETQYRTFGMEIIARGQKHKSDNNWSHVTVREEGCIYKLDFQHVYWNSKLAHEHQRIVKAIQQDAKKRSSSPTIVADLMAGIGPFAIPLTTTTTTNNNKSSPSTPVIVYANDLNPISYQYLVENSKQNKCENLYMYNMDGRQFCHYIQDKIQIKVSHYIMNLPKIALELLDAFRGYKIGRISEQEEKPNDDDNNDDSSNISNLPYIHVHCFASKNQDEAYEEILDRAQRALGCTIHKDTDKISIHLVRDVSPNKNMYCLTFQLPSRIQQLPRIDISNINNTDHISGTSQGVVEEEVVRTEPATKKMKAAVDN